MATNNLYDVNFKRLALLLLPTFRRRPLLAALVYAAVSPLQYLHMRFMRWRRDTDYRLLHNGQVCYLRGLLNDLFDPIDRRITVSEEVSNIGNIVLHKREVQRAVRFPARGSGRMVVLNRRGYGGVNSYDFWVNIPIALLNEIDADRVRAVVDAYKLASKRYQINFV
ncbi:hypothetical protein [Alistipes timonensis]|jgi:hypothetical protein|uniref:hypothetical protein n=1 Tax=Alistipes timonensis TaxID=1465754 RepID=UPI001C3E4542|nr:hypothetical protein [Alistipes timonensis]MCR2030821.1 hypothetical protein [Alistipes timonensis]